MIWFRSGTGVAVGGGGGVDVGTRVCVGRGVAVEATVGAPGFAGVGEPPHAIKADVISNEIAKRVIERLLNISTPRRFPSGTS